LPIKKNQDGNLGDLGKNYCAGQNGPVLWGKQTEKEVRGRRSQEREAEKKGKTEGAGEEKKKKKNRRGVRRLRKQGKGGGIPGPVWKRRNCTVGRQEKSKPNRS